MTQHQTPQVPINEEGPVYKRIAWWIENSLVRFIKRVFNILAEPIRNLFHFSLTDWLEEMEGEFATTRNEAIDYMLTWPGIPTPLRNILLKIKASEGQVFVLAALAGVVMLLIEMVKSFVPIVMETPQQLLKSALRTSLIDPYVLVNLYTRGDITEAQLNAVLAKYGIDEPGITALKKGTISLIEEDELTQGLWRKEISEDTVRVQLLKRGYSDEAVNLWLKVRQMIPSPAELVSIATREGFDSGVAAKYGYDDNYPQLAAEWAEKQGLSQEWFRRLWRVHWQLPSISAGFEMFQRRIITREELELLMRVSDIPSFWRNSLIKLSYNNITRVDVRRMYQLHVIDELEVYRRYLDLGYTGEDASKMTEWTIKEYGEEDRNLTKGDILGMYRDHVLNPNEARTYLTALEYTSDEIDLYLAREDLHIQQVYEKDVTDQVHDLYLTNDLDRTDVWAQLGKLNPPSGYISNLLELWELEKRRRAVKPSVTDLRDMWLFKSITENQLETELKSKGYSEEYITWYKDFWVKKYG